MEILEISKDQKLKVSISEIDEADFKIINKKRYYFNWEEEKEFTILKLTIQGQNDILGLISIENFVSESYILIRLLAASKENVGKKKLYDGIASSLIAHVAKLAVREYGPMACIALHPKTELANHYIEKYNMSCTGKTLSIMVPEILDLIKKFGDEE